MSDRESISFTFNNQDFEQVASQRVTLIDELLAIGNALSSSQDLHQLLKLIVSKSREITCSDAGSVYLVDRNTDPAQLIFKVAQNDSLGELFFHEYVLPLTKKSLAGYVALTGETLNIADAYNLSSSLPILNKVE